MKKTTLHVALLLFLFCIITYTRQAYFTHTLTRGRLGDHLISYAQCKYLAWKHNAIMLYKPFKYSDKFMFSIQEKSINNAHRSFKQKKQIDDENKLKSLQANTLYELSYKINITDGIIYSVWKSPEFHKKLQRALTPVSLVKLMKLPQNIITVALHIRKGSGGDPPLSSQQIYQTNTTKKQPKATKYTKHIKRSSDRSPHVLKFPPEQYYIDQLTLLSDLLDHPPLYVYVFTDAKDPYALTERIREYTNKTNITFNCRKETNTKRADAIDSVLEDLYDMAQFDIIIRADSNLSKTAQLIGNHVLGFSPNKCHWEENKLIIDEVSVLIRQKSGQQVKKYFLPQDMQSLYTEVQKNSL